MGVGTRRGFDKGRAISVPIFYFFISFFILGVGTRGGFEKGRGISEPVFFCGAQVLSKKKREAYYRSKKDLSKNIK